MKTHIIKNRVIYSIIITGIQTILVGILVALYSNELINGNDLLESFNNSKRYFFLLLVVLTLFLFQVYLGIIERNHIMTEKEQIVNDILRAACFSLLYPHNNLHIRAIITVCDYKNNIRKTKYYYNIATP